MNDQSKIKNQESIANNFNNLSSYTTDFDLIAYKYSI